MMNASNGNGNIGSGTGTTGNNGNNTKSVVSSSTGDCTGSRGGNSISDDKSINKNAMSHNNNNNDNIRGDTIRFNIVLA